MANTKRPRRRSTLGTIIEHRNHYKARYLRGGRWHTPGHTFSTFAEADGWLADEQRLIDRDEWTPPADRRARVEAEQAAATLTFGTYSEQWIRERQVRGRALKESTAASYRNIRKRQLAPLLAVPLVAVDRALVAAWYRQLNADTPTRRAHAYALFRAVMNSAVDDGLVPENPVRVTGAGAQSLKPEVELFTAGQIAQVADLMPAKHRAAVLLAAWCGLRFGELAALQRGDLDLPKDGSALLHVRRGVVKVEGKHVLTTPKSTSGLRTVPIPPHIVADLRHHLKHFARWGADGLVFPPTHAGAELLTPGQLYGHRPTYNRDKSVRTPGYGYYRARHLLGRDDLSFHKLRHFAATNYAVAGATTKELMTLLGHAGPGVAMRYQHAAQSRLADLAASVSARASGYS